MPDLLPAPIPELQNRRVLVLDYETFFSSYAGYSLRKMSSEAYITDPQFQVHGACVLDLEPSTLEPRAPAQFLDEASLRQFLSEVDWPGTVLVGHNLLFDGSILAWRYGHVPALYLDTMSMAAMLVKPFTGKVSLDVCAETHGLPKKTGALKQVDGLRTDEIRNVPGLWDAFAAYAIQDGEVTAALFRQWVGLFPRQELTLIDWAIRAYTCPRLRLDRAGLQRHLDEVQAERDRLLEACGLTDASILRSTQLFAQALERLGVTVDTKPGKNGEIPALAKDDPFMRDLLQSPNEQIRAMAMARLAWASNLEVTRARRLLGMASCLDGYIAVPLAYHSARTGRLGGTESLNMMNLTRNSGLRRAIQAPPEHTLVVADLSQIEARLVAYLAGCETLLSGFRDGRDLYADFATLAFSRQDDPVRKDRKEDAPYRFVGKTCLAAGTLVLTDEGWLPIENVKLYHKVWDGEEWVCHEGLIYQSVRKTIRLSGISVTPEHVFWCGDRTYSAASLTQDAELLSEALATGSARLPSQAGCWGKSTVVLPMFFDVIAERLNMLHVVDKLNLIELQNAYYVPKSQLLNIDGTLMFLPCLMVNIERVYLIDLTMRLNVVIILIIPVIKIMEPVELWCVKSGDLIAQHFYNIFRLYRVGMIHLWKWIEFKPMVTMNLEIFDLLPNPLICGTSAGSPTSKLASESWKPVYDLANAGPRHRFTILADDGPMIASNCTLGLGYGLGGSKLADRLTIGGVPTAPDEGDRLVKLWRGTYKEVRWLWRTLEDLMIAAVTTGSEQRWREMEFHPDHVLLPSGRRLHYPHLQMTASGLQYLDMRWNKWAKLDGGPLYWQKLWGGMILENLAQALARDIISVVHAELADRVVLQVHDELVLVVPEDEAELTRDQLLTRLSTPPAWAEDLPLDAEAVVARRYAK